MIYLDSSALVTFIVRRRNVEQLERFLAAQVTHTCTSTIGMVETVRTCDRLGSYPNLMPRLLRDHTEITVTNLIRDAAATVPGPIRTLDAIHIASAEMLGSELIALVTYDKRMAETARDNGLPVAMPGME
ncbi:type II toxin-antitoxin system VapC family toxin [Actinophytocola sp.]|uniref:type II toxin-antitoxin system VapC family toxin n=1 Tax=Actinophytocola sp. TaxID=1872138 RepID=UPI002D7FEB56|nr:type II toxin-antitoxin system VapC family toxin [Actinophytocola sp.]HET9141378.1 type II toxin-antitoxin system VapC family toxin [Actinophytocola sp.]